MATSKKEITALNSEEIAQVHGGTGEIAAKYLGIRAQDTKSGSVKAMYASVRAGDTKSNR